MSEEKVELTFKERLLKIFLIISITSIVGFFILWLIVWLFNLTSYILNIFAISLGIIFIISFIITFGNIVLKDYKEIM